MTTFQTTTAEIPRDRFGRPLIQPPGGGKAEGYTRCTTYVKALDDLNNLMEWKARMVLLGAAKSDTIVKAAKVHTVDDKRALKELVEQAMTLAGAGNKATDGTTLHKLTEILDAGQPIPDGLDATTLADLEAYRKGTAHCTMDQAEAFVVCDDLKVAGTFDRLLTVPTTGVPDWLAGRTVIADLKTGSLDYAIGAISMQLAVYAHGDLYNPTTHTRTPHGADTTYGLVIHLPAGTAKCSLYAVNLVAGWEAVQLATRVRDWRSNAKLKNLARPLGNVA